MVCKSPFVTYLAMGLYIVFPFFNVLVTQRFYSAIPEEYGMMFILPGTYFFFRFIRQRKEELSEGSYIPRAKGQLFKKNHKMDQGEVNRPTGRFKLFLAFYTIVIKNWRIWFDKAKDLVSFNMKSQWSLLFFMIHLALVLTVHFYSALVFLFLFLGIILAFGSTVFKRGMFGSMLKAGFGGVGLAILPMVLALLFGATLQYSLLWGVGLISGAQTSGPGVTTPTAGFMGRVGAWYTDLYSYLMPTAPIPLFLAMFGALLLLIVLGIFLLARKKAVSKSEIPGDYPFTEKGRGLFYLALGFAMVLLLPFFNAPAFFLPTIIPIFRLNIYFAYLMTVVAALLLDGTVQLFFDHQKTISLFRYTPIAAMAVAATLLIVTGRYGKPVIPDQMETNGSIVATSNILRNEPNGNWTIVSAFDESVMLEDFGYHYEIITFLQEMNTNPDSGNIVIPTPSVYFYIEKVPLIYDYSLSYTGGGTKISTDEAAKTIDYTKGFANYAVENRLIVMSKMYYWAQEYMKSYPNEMKVFFEDDDFVCYMITQNPFRLLNFAINYTYN